MNQLTNLNKNYVIPDWHNQTLKNICDVECAINIVNFKTVLTSFSGLELCDLSLKHDSPTDSTDLVFAAEHIALYLSSRDLHNNTIINIVQSNLPRHCVTYYFQVVTALKLSTKIL